MKTIRSYSELIRLPTFEQRYEYLKIGGIVGESTFGFDRYLNQSFYKSREWRTLRDKIILRDEASDLAIKDYPISKWIVIHHMNPITEEDIDERIDDILNPEFLVCVSLRTHNAIHFGDESLLPDIPIERFKNDTCPWRL